MFIFLMINLFYNLFLLYILRLQKFVNGLEMYNILILHLVKLS